MIKSYKIVIIIQIIIILLGSFIFNSYYYSDYDKIETALVVVFGSSALIIAAVSILIQRMIVGVLNSDSTTDEINEQTPNDKFWKNSFLIYIILGVLTFIVAIVGLSSDIELGVRNGGFMFDFFSSLIVLIISSLSIGLLLRVRDSINEITKFLGILMILISAIIFSGCLFLASSASLWVTSYNHDSLYGRITSLFKGDDSQIDTLPEDVAVVDETVGDNARESEGEGEGEEPESDYYGFSEMSFPDVETEGYFKNLFNDEKYDDAKVQDLTKLFLSDYLALEKGKSFSGIRKAAEKGFYYEIYDEINKIVNKIRRNPEEIRSTFDSYNMLLYAFLSEKNYYDSSLNETVNILISSHDDIYKTEDPEQTLDKIYKTMIFGAKKEFPEYYFDNLKSYASENTLSSISKNADANAESDDSNPDYNSKLNTTWIYSFWARRYKEKNSDVVYEILKEIKEHYEDN
ncbi:MFS transporter [Flavobacterium branchiicola]|uniref:Uncharacterized protein n=1 Tax=Flavobacterium branchiicola TaxID=1114875 RepID=A0ABV9PJU3_9FLAO|nr:hypothetical protein [Flavobacterium branchiicola]MBS7256293.1 hypothetical protein [Flavobacterium branchiicola]